jgi:hypothetical protein
MRLLTDDEMIHVPLGYLNKYGEEVPDAIPLLSDENCIPTLTRLIKTKYTFIEKHKRDPTEDELTKLLYPDFIAD